MKLNKKVLLGSSAALVALSPLAAQQLRAATVSVPAQATIAEAIAFSGTVGMNFGSLTEVGAGTVALDFADGLTPSANISVVGGTPSTGEVKITASTGTVLDISLNGVLPIVLKTTVSALASMNITDIQFQYNGVSGTAITAPVIASPDTLLIGGTLAVGAGQKSGVYQGMVKIDVVYQ